MTAASTRSRLTLGQVLAMPVFRQGGPQVVAGAAGLTGHVRWVHASELPDVASLLRPGDLVLTTGVAMPADDDVAGLTAVVEDLAAVECSGLVIELGRRWRERLPDALASACERSALPLVALTHQVRFANLTQAVGERVVDDQLAELRDAQRVHDTFTELSFTQAGPREVLDAVQRLADAAIVVENAQHRPLDYLPGTRADQGFLENWQARSARVQISERTGWDEQNGWLLTRLGTREQTWGRLVIESPEPPSQRLVAVAERAAAALALHRLHDRDRDAALRRAHAELMAGLAEHPDDEDWARRAELAGFPTLRRRFVGVVVRPAVAGAGRFDAGEVTAAVVAAAEALRVAALVSEQDRDVVVLLSAPLPVDLVGVVDRLAARIGDHRDVLIAAGSPTTRRGGVEITLREARQVADSVPLSVAARARGTAHRLDDTHLRGLLALLGDDERVRLFARRELAPIHDHDRGCADRPGAALLPVLRALLSHPTSKSEAAAAVHLSRAAFYDRLSRLEKVLRADLDDPDVRVALQVALLVEEMYGA